MRIKTPEAKTQPPNPCEKETKEIEKDLIGIFTKGINPEDFKKKDHLALILTPQAYEVVARFEEIWPDLPDCVKQNLKLSDIPKKAAIKMGIPIAESSKRGLRHRI